MNAINGALSNGLWTAIQELDADNSLVAGVITGTGRAFCAGMDLKAFARGEDIGPLNKFVRSGAEKPLIAAVNGFALAGGCEVMLTCDLIVAASDAKIGIREVKVGLFAAAGGVFRLPSRVGYAKAMEMALTGEPITAQQALDAGLLSEMTEPGEAQTRPSPLPNALRKMRPLRLRPPNLWCGPPPWASRKTSFGRCRYRCKNPFLRQTMLKKARSPSPRSVHQTGLEPNPASCYKKRGRGPFFALDSRRFQSCSEPFAQPTNALSGIG